MLSVVPFNSFAAAGPFYRQYSLREYVLISPITIFLIHLLWPIVIIDTVPASIILHHVIVWRPRQASSRSLDRKTSRPSQIQLTDSSVNNSSRSTKNYE